MLHKIGVGIAVVVVIFVLLAATGGPEGLGELVGDIIKGFVAFMQGIGDGIS